MFFEWRQWSHSKIDITSEQEIPDLLEQIGADEEICGKEYTIGGTYYHVCKLFLSNDGFLVGLNYSHKGGVINECYVYNYSTPNPSMKTIGDAILAVLYHEGKWSSKYIIETLQKAINYNPDYSKWIDTFNKEENGLEILNIEWSPENTIVNAHYVTKAYGDGWSRERTYVYKIDGFSDSSGGSCREPECHRFVDFKAEDENYKKYLPDSLSSLSLRGWGGTLLLPWELFTTRKITFNVLEEGD